MTARTALLNDWGKDALAGALPVLIGVVAFGVYAPRYDHPWAPDLFLAALGLAFAVAGLRCALRLRGSLSILAALVLGASLGGTVAGEIIDWHSGGAPVSPEFRIMLAWLSGVIFWEIAVVVDFLRQDDWLPAAAIRRRSAWGVLLLSMALFALAIVTPLAR